MRDAAVAFYAVFQQVSGGYQVQLFRQLKFQIEAGKLAASIGVPTAARTHGEDVIARILNHLAFMLNLHFSLLARAQWLCRNEHKDFVDTSQC